MHSFSLKLCIATIDLKHSAVHCTHNHNVYFAIAGQNKLLYHSLAIYTEVTFVNVTLEEAVPSGGGPAVV